MLRKLMSLSPFPPTLLLPVVVTGCPCCFETVAVVVGGLILLLEAPADVDVAPPVTFTL